MVPAVLTNRTVIQRIMCNILHPFAATFNIYFAIGRDRFHRYPYEFVIQNEPNISRYEMHVAVAGSLNKIITQILVKWRGPPGRIPLGRMKKV
jgi:hypothetical protein